MVGRNGIWTHMEELKSLAVNAADGLGGGGRRPASG